VLQMVDRRSSWSRGVTALVALRLSPSQGASGRMLVCSSSDDLMLAVSALWDRSTA
jgi:hypothetical protein